MAKDVLVRWTELTDDKTAEDIESDRGGVLELLAELFGTRDELDRDGEDALVVANGTKDGDTKIEDAEEVSEDSTCTCFEHVDDTSTNTDCVVDDDLTGVNTAIEDRLV